MEKNGFEVLGGGGVGGDGDWVGWVGGGVSENFWEISGTFPRNFREIS